MELEKAPCAVGRRRSVAKLWDGIPQDKRPDALHKGRSKSARPRLDGSTISAGLGHISPVRCPEDIMEVIHALTIA